MPIPRLDYAPLPAVIPRRVSDTRTLGDLLRRQGENALQFELAKGQTAAQLWRQLGQAFSSFAQGRREDDATATALKLRKEERESADQLKRDEIAERKAERAEADRIRKEAERRQLTADAAKVGDAVAEAVGYGPMSEPQMEQVLGSPAQAGRARYSFGPGTAEGPELLPTKDQARMIEAERVITGMGGAIGPNGQIVMPPKPATAKALQRETALVNGRPTIVNFNPETGTYTNQKGDAVEVEYMPPPRSGNGGQRPLTQTAEAALITRLSRDWSAQSKPTRELERQVRIMDAGMEAVRRGDLSQGAQQVLVTFQKILDPPSVVRDSEFWRSANGQSLMNRVRGAYERLTKGGVGVTADELQKFAELARETAKAQQGSYLDRVKDRIGRTASRYNIPLELVFEADEPDESSTVTPGGKRNPNR